MTTAASYILRRAVDILQDVTAVRWPTPEMVRWLNDGQRAIQLVRPDATAQTVTATLQPGVRQEMKLMSLTKPPSKLMNVARNMAATSKKRTITKTSRELLENHQPNWYSTTATVDILHYTFDPRTPDEFEVYPPAPATPAPLAQVELTYSAFPVDIAEPAAGSLWSAVVGNIDVGDAFQLPLIDYICYRAMTKDAEVANVARAAGFLQAFQSALGADMQGTLAVQPQTKEGATA